MKLKDLFFQCWFSTIVYTTAPSSFSSPFSMLSQRSLCHQHAVHFMVADVMPPCRRVFLQTAPIRKHNVNVTKHMLLAYVLLILKIVYVEHIANCFTTVVLNFTVPPIPSAVRLALLNLKLIVHHQQKVSSFVWSRHRLVLQCLSS